MALPSWHPKDKPDPTSGTLEGQGCAVGCVQCKPCPVGSYNPTPNSPYCIPCSCGKTTNSTGSASVDDCVGARLPHCLPQIPYMLCPSCCRRPC